MRALLVSGIGIPFAMWVTLIWKRHTLNALCKQQLGYAHKSYRLSKWLEGIMFQFKLLELLLVL